MSRPPEGKPSDPMSREVDRLLRQLGRPGSPSIATRAALPSVRPKPIAAVAKRPSPGAVWARAALAVLIALAMTQWPYAHACGLPLAGYLAALGVALGAAAVAARTSWRVHDRWAHTAAILALLVATALAAGEVVPRLTGTALQGWACGS